MLIDRVGRFRGIPTQGVIGKSKNGFPQLIVQLQVTEMFDETVNEETGEPLNEWVDWTEWDMSITGYFVLFNATKALLNYEQVMKAFNWNGTDLEALQRTDFGDLQVSFEVEENTYSNQTRLQVNWIDNYDAEGRSLKPMESSDIKALADQFSNFMVAAPKAKPVKKTRGKAKPKAKVVAPAVPVRSTAVSPTVSGTGSVMPQDEAWTQLNVLAEEAKIESEPLADAWLNAADSVQESSGVPQGDFTNENWGTVFDIASKTIAV